MKGEAERTAMAGAEAVEGEKKVVMVGQGVEAAFMDVLVRHLVSRDEQRAVELPAGMPRGRRLGRMGLAVPHMVDCVRKIREKYEFYRKIRVFI